MTPFIYILLFLAANALVAGVVSAGRRAGARQAATEAETARIDGIRQGGLRGLLLVRRQQYTEAEGPLAEQRDEHQRVRVGLEATYDKIKKQLWRDGDWHAGFVVVVAVLTLAWTFLFALVRALDVQMIEALGYFGGNQLMAQAAGTIIALAFALIGVIVAGLLGLHSFLPRWIEIGRPLRVFLVANLLTLALVGALALRHVAINRSERVLGPQVTNLQAQVAADQQTGASPLDLRIAQLRLAQAQQRLQAGESVDRLLAVVGPLLEMAVSWAPLYAGEMLVLLGFGLAIRRHRRQQLALTGQINQLNRRFTRTLTEDALAAGFAVEDVEQQLQPPPELPPAGPPDPPNPAREEPRAAEQSPDSGAAPHEPPPDEPPAATPEPDPAPTPRPGPAAGTADPDADGWTLA